MRPGIGFGQLFQSELFILSSSSYFIIQPHPIFTFHLTFHIVIGNHDGCNDIGECYGRVNMFYVWMLDCTMLSEDRMTSREET